MIGCIIIIIIIIIIDHVPVALRTAMMFTLTAGFYVFLYASYVTVSSSSYIAENTFPFYMAGSFLRP
jgi:hypothetical protein